MKEIKDLQKALQSFLVAYESNSIQCRSYPFEQSFRDIADGLQDMLDTCYAVEKTESLFLRDIKHLL